ncbi:MAG: hypothetical protein ABR879_06060, partial [Methanomassiliicoccales archaeon]
HLAKIALMTVPPLCALLILSFDYLNDRALFGAIIAGVSALLLFGAFLLYRGIEGRWGRESFSF